MTSADLTNLLNTIKIRDCLSFDQQLKQIGITRTTYINFCKDNNPTIKTVSKIVNYLKKNKFKVEYIMHKGIKIVC